ncbi:MAG: site-specific DNA-methyltransferase [Planctomycetota bacterium]
MKVHEPELILGDAANIPLADNSVDLVITSPPYGSQRSYGIGFVMGDPEWVQWTADCFVECTRACKGLVAFVVEGYTRKGTFHPLPELLTAELHRRGVNLRQRNIFMKHGAFGGSPDEFARKHEIVVCGSKNAGRLPYANPKACGHPPKCPPGGIPSHQSRDGRVNRPRLHQAGGGSERRKVKQYKPPQLCKASDVIDCGAVGGGNMGSWLSGENEASFPEKLADRYVRSFSRLGDTVLDPFVGSGTTLAVAMKTGRKSIGIDIRESQIDLCKRRIEEARSIINGPSYTQQEAT